MASSVAQDPRYPIGPFEPAPPPGAAQRLLLVEQLALAPGEFRAVVADLTQGQLDTPYRPGGWTVRQVVHHLADAQMNWYVRTKLALTEDQPIVRPYDEARWAETEEALRGPVEPSLQVLDGLYQRWTALFRSLTEEQWTRRMVHPERGTFQLDTTLPMHVWHGRHHTAHITSLRKCMTWQ
jgi:uncharacterized damage-inducible protein DinB